MSSVEVRAAEVALHRRAAWACAAAPGRFRVWEHVGVLAVLAEDPALGFLSSVSGVGPDTLPEAIRLADAPVWGTVAPTLVVPVGLGGAALSGAGFTRVGQRPLAIAPVPASTAPESDVVAADGSFADVLLAGYEVDGPVAAFIRAEHRLATVRGLFLMRAGSPIAAAAMSLHGDVAVLGGASTLREHRGRGAQTRLLRHRLHLAAEAGATLAVATAAAGSASAANLRAAGFALHERLAWRRPRTPGSTPAPGGRG
ncbi:GNAT family N-acetyltransferase [Actinokineospora guangxiensis]|uniref:GNAT family N-acetyltransferase n=1 Tax=Actinokineospora guangxiensis TaxID=1490288 RepID=A0ABW0ESI9_9PSEU